MVCEKRSITGQSQQANFTQTQSNQNFNKEGYLSFLFKNITSQFNKDPCRTKVHEQIIGSLIFWSLYTYTNFFPIFKNIWNHPVYNFPSLDFSDDRRKRKSVFNKYHIKNSSNIKKLCFSFWQKNWRILRK